VSASQKSSSGNGIGLGTILFLIFLVLKLTHYIDWSWWWVTAPLWIPAAVIVVIGGTALIAKGLRR
jgi:hypothetical protein